MSEETPSPKKPDAPAAIEPNIARMLHVPEAEATTAPPPPPKKKRWWLRIIGMLVLLIIVLVACAPYIASTGPVRSIVVGQINNNLNGSVAIDDYSVGWTGGIKANGVRVFDANKQLVLSVPRVSTQLSLLDAIRGKLHLGDTRIQLKLDSIIIDENGNANIASLAKQSPDAAGKSRADRGKQGAQPIDVPDITGNITIDILGGSISGAGVPAPITVEPSTIVLAIADINQPVYNDVKLQYRMGSTEPSSISASGQISAVQNSKIDPNTITSTIKAVQKIALRTIDLSVIAPILRTQLGADADISGIGGGALDVSVAGITGISATGEFNVENARFIGAAVRDQLVLKQIAVPIRITRTVVDANTTKINIEKLAITTPLASVNVTGELTQEMLDRLKSMQPPGADGKLNVEISVPNLGEVARALPKTLKLAEGVTVDSGSLNSTQEIVFTKDSIRSNQKLHLVAQGSNNGKKIQLSSIDLETAAVALPNGKPVPPLRDIKLALTSGFINLRGGGDSLAKIDVKGDFDLARLRDEAAQFSDLGSTQLSGAGQLHLATAGDLAVTNGPISTALDVSATNVRISGSDMQSINQPRIALSAGGNVMRDSQGAPTTLDNGTLTLQAGDAGNPLVDVQANAQLDLIKRSAPSFELAKFAVNNLADAQRQFGGLMPALKAQQIIIESGAIYAQMKGSFDGKTITLDEKKPLGFSLPNLVISKAGKQVMGREDISGSIAGSIGTGDAISAHLSTLSVKAKSNLFSIDKSGDPPIDVTLGGGGIKGNGAVAIAADLARLNQIARAFGGHVAIANDPGQVTSGKFDGVLNLANAPAQGTTISFDGKATNLTVTTAAKPLQNETVTLALRASSPDDRSGVNVSNASLESRFATAKVTDGSLKMGQGVWEMIQKLNVAVNIPDLPAAYGLLNALAPPAAATPGAVGIASPPAQDPVMLSIQQDEPAPARKARRKPAADEAPPAEDASAPLAPLDVTSGSATMNLAVTRDAASKTTSVAVTDFRISKLGIARGAQTYAFDKDIAFALKSSIVAADAPNRSDMQQISRLKVDTLDGDLGIAKLSMPKPIEASGLGDMQNFVANGAVKVDGTVDALTPMLAVLQGKPAMPYTGSYTTTQTIATRAGDEARGALVSLTGELVVSNFVVTDAGKPVFTEKTINIRNDVDAYPKIKSAIVRGVSLDMPETQAVAMKFSGRVADWDGNRTIKGDNAETARLDLGYDLAKLWPAVKPMLSPDMQESLKDSKLEGKYQKTFNVYGSYPQRATWQESIRYLSADGAFAVQLFDGMGLNIGNLDVPITLTKGVLQTVYGGKSGQSGAAKPATCNGGALDLSGITIALTTPEPRVSMPKNHKLLVNATINPLLGDTLGKFINPMFANTQRAKGLLNVTVVYCENIALGDKLKSADSGRAQIVMSITDMDIANPLGSQMLGKIVSAIPSIGGKNFAAGQSDSFQGELKDATATVDRGVTSAKGTFMLIDPTTAAAGAKSVARGAKPAAPRMMPMTFDGTIQMSDLRQSFNVSVPAELVATFVPDQKFGETLVKVFPSGIPLAWKGTSTKTQIELGDIGRKFLEGQLKNGEGIGNILDQLGGGKKDKDKKGNRGR